MIRNYFKSAFRNFRSNKVTSFINLFGLSVGMTAAVFIFLWVQNEISFDSYHPNKEHIYRITNTIQISKEENWVWESSPMLMAETALKEIPEVEKAARVLVNTWGGPVFSINNQLFSEKTSAWVDKSWLSLFHYDFVEGNAAAFGQDPFSIVLTQSKAKKYFGNANAAGKVIRLDTVNYTVRGVIKDNPVNSSFQFDILLQMDGRLSNPAIVKNDKTWNNFNYMTFLQLQPDAVQAKVEGKLQAMINSNRENKNTLVSIKPLSNLYFEEELQSSELPHGNRKTTYIFSLLGLLLLVTACINYVNLTTARASLRAREVSVRKIVGAQKRHLFFQFITESFTVSFLSLLITVLLLQVCLPVFNSITEKQFQLPITSAAVWKVLGGTLLIAAVLNGIYPAALLSSFKPLRVFGGRAVFSIRDGAVRKVLVVFQFTLSIVLIIGTIVIYRQLHYIQTTNPGYNVSQIMAIQIPYKSYGSLDDDTKKSFFSGIRHELQSQSSIAAVSSGNAEIVNVNSSSSGNADWDGRDTAFNPTIVPLSADADFQLMFGLQLISGHWFRPGNIDEHNYILNETAAAMFNMHQPIIGQRFTWGSDTGQVIAIVKDFHFRSMHEKIGPMVLSNHEMRNSIFFVKIAPGNIPQALRTAAGIWTKFIPGQPFDYAFLDDRFQTLYKADIKTSRLVFIFSGIAIIISALGLFGLAAFTAERRTKEIGIRKVLGASVQQIATLLSKDFIRLVLIAIVIASPVAWWLMNKWLQAFAYRVDIHAWIFVTAGSMAILIALLSVSVQAVKAAITNPVKSLRTE